MEYNKIWIQNHNVTKTKTITNTSITYKVTIAPKKQHCVNANKFLARQVFGTYAIRLISQMVSSTK